MTNLRRSRGYGFETWLVQKFQESGWDARRLGGASTGLPDVVAVNNRTGDLYAIEAKSLRGKSVTIPIDEINRCRDIGHLFFYYNSKIVIATRLGENRKPVYNYWYVYNEQGLTKVRAHMDYLEVQYEGEPMKVEDRVTMPWETNKS